MHKTNEKAISWLKDYQKKKGYSDTTEEIFETLLNLKVLWKGNHNEHRWYICVDKVVKLEDKFFGFRDYIITGDNSMSDMGLEYELDSIYEAEPKEKTVIVYSEKE